MREEATTKNTKNTEVFLGFSRQLIRCFASSFAFALAAWLISSPVDAQRASSFDFSIKNIMRGPELYGRPPTDLRWSADSRWIYFNWLEPGTDWREQVKRYRVRAVAGSKPERVSPAQFDSVGALVTSGDRSRNGRYMAG